MLSWWEVRSKWSGSNLPFTYKRPKMVSQERVLECGCFSKKCAVKTVVISRESDIRWWLERDKDLEEAVNYQRHLGCRSTHKLWLTNWEGCVWRLLFLSLRDLRFSVDDRYLSRGWLFNRKDSIFWESLQTQFSWSKKGFFADEDKMNKKVSLSSTSETQWPFKSAGVVACRVQSPGEGCLLQKKTVKNVQQKGKTTGNSLYCSLTCVNNMPFKDQSKHWLNVSWVWNNTRKLTDSLSNCFSWHSSSFPYHSSLPLLSPCPSPSTA